MCWTWSTRSLCPSYNLSWLDRRKSRIIYSILNKAFFKSNLAQRECLSLMIFRKTKLYVLYKVESIPSLRIEQVLLGCHLFYSQKYTSGKTGKSQIMYFRNGMFFLITSQKLYIFYMLGFKLLIYYKTR